MSKKLVMKFLTVLYYVTIILTSVYLQESLAIFPESSFRKKPNTKTAEFKQPVFRQIPREFDARKHWPRCTVIGTVWHQGNCASSWAFSTTQVMADRTCIATNASINRLFSAEDLLHCCRECTDNITLNGCEGGWPLSAYEFWNKYGVVTGGTGFEKDGCKPYTPTSYNYKPAKDKFKPRNCIKKCQKYYNENVTFYENDKYYGNLGYEIPGNVETMQLEILENGPISVMFYVYENFRNYKRGVYQIPGQKILGTHSVKIVGWGVDSKDGPYWTAANTWGKGWGEKGYFKIARGSNFCDIEAHATAAKPILIPNSASISSTPIYILLLCLITSAVINEMLNFHPTLFKKII